MTAGQKPVDVQAHTAALPHPPPEAAPWVLLTEAAGLTWSPEARHNGDLFRAQRAILLHDCRPRRVALFPHWQRGGGSPRSTLTLGVASSGASR